MRDCEVLMRNIESTSYSVYVTSKKFDVDKYTKCKKNI